MATSRQRRLRSGASAFRTINLLPLLLDRGESIFGSWKDVAWFDDHDRFRHVVPFDFYIPEEAAAFHPIGSDMTVHYHYFGEDLHSTGRSFREYIELLFQSRGLYGWVPSLCAETQALGNIQDFRTSLPSLSGTESELLFHPR
jgi:hypothetical protein